ncbi:MAG TPA: EAL domain-containing protein [Chloroflexota bacterium]
MPSTSAVRPRTGTLGADAHARFAAHVRSFLPFDRFSLCTIEDEGRSLVIAYTESADVRVFTTGEPYPIDETLARYLDPSGACVIRSDFAALADGEMCRGERMALDAGLRSVGLVPLLADDQELIGILHIWSKQPAAYTISDLAPLVLLAPLVTAALQNARAQDRAERLAREAETRATELVISRSWLHANMIEQEELRRRATASEERLRAVYQAISCAVLVLDASGAVVEVNSAAEEILGTKRETMIGFPIHLAPWSLTHRDGVPFGIEERPATVARRERRSLRQLPLRVVRPDGSERLVEMDAVPQIGPDGVVEQVIVSYVDRTGRVRAEQALRTSQDLLRTAVTNAPIVITMADKDGVITFSEGRGLERLGRTPGSTVGQSAFTLFQDTPAVLDCLRRVLDGESCSCRVDFGTAVFETLYTPLYAGDGSLRGAISVSTDITERVRNEEALRASEARFRTAFLGAPIGMSLIGLDGRFVQVNPAMCALLGYAEPDFIGAHVLRRVAPEDFETARAYLRTLIEGRTDSATVELRLLRKDDSVIWVQVSSTLSRDEHGRPGHLVNQVQDITARKEAETALKDEAARLSAIIEAQHAIAMVGLDLDAVMRLIVRFASSLTNASGSVIAMVDDGEMVFRAGEGALASAEGTHLSLDASLSGLCARTGESFICNDALSDPRADAAACRRLGVGSLLAVPLIYEQNTIGVLEAMHHEPHAFGQRDITTLQLMTGLLISAMSTCDAFAAEQQALEALMMSEERFRGMLEMAPVGACIVNEEGIFESVNASICELYGYTREELTGQPYTLVLPPPDSAGAAGAHHPPEMVIGEQRQGEGLVLAKDGRELTVLTNSVVFVGDDSRIHCAYFVFDITERKRFENHLSHAAHHDALTGLPNRVLYHDRLGQALLAAQRQGYALSILMIDLNGFKRVNDTLGHDAGDKLLREVALRLQAVVRSGDTVARLGGDEFGVVLPQSDEAGATRVANKIRAAFAPAILIDGREAYIGGSVGIAVFGEHGDDAESLQKAADLAMYAAKEEGGGHAVYIPSLAGEPLEAQEPRDGKEPRERRRPSISAELRQAIIQGDLRLHYQPLVSCTDGGVRRVEALVRWQHPEQGLLPPAYFITAAEQSGAITPLTIWVLEEAMRQYQIWRRQGLDLGIAVNVSLRTLRESQFPDLVVALLRQYRISPGDLTLEITENSILEEQEQTLTVLRSLADLGVRIALDDVGIGHSSLEYITQLPVHELKVDRSFLSAAPGSKGHAVVCCILGLGTALDLSVVVEGVETQEAWDWLIGMGCEWAQGYFMSRPLPPEAVEIWYKAHPLPEADAESTTPASA